jgi:hypothetical protein
MLTAIVLLGFSTVMFRCRLTFCWIGPPTNTLHFIVASPGARKKTEVLNPVSVLLTL